MPTEFSTLPLDPTLLANLDSLNYREMTPIQAACLPPMLAGKDLIAQAKTGSGKTVAFGIGVLHKLDASQFKVQALVLCPTRELADQVGKELRRLARATPNIKLLTLCGGAPLGPQVGSLEYGAHIVVGTPGRILKHLGKGTLTLDHVQTLVLDEADRMLDMGFYDDIAAIVAATPASRQTLLFSATYPDTIKQLSSAFARQPVDISVDAVHSDGNIQQHFYEVAKEQRTQTLAALLAHHQPESSVVFCNTRQQCQELADDLQQRGVHAMALHGDLEQKERDQVLVLFANKSCSLLIATDVAARGLDIKDLPAVINFELSHDPEIHIHRIGRTGRAGNAGLALSLFTRAEAYRVTAIESYQCNRANITSTDTLNHRADFNLQPPMITLAIDGGRKDKVRPGDILGALTGAGGIPGDAVGKIDVFDFITYVAIQRALGKQALSCLTEGKIKGRRFKVRTVR